MGRALGLLAGVVSLARLLVDALQVARDLRAGRAPAQPLGDPSQGGPAETAPARGSGGVGPGGPEAGPGAGQERANPDGTVTAG